MNYVLLKDLPDVKPGTILEPSGDYYCIFKDLNGNKVSYLYGKETVENSPEWFTPQKNATTQQWVPLGDILNILDKFTSQLEDLKETLKNVSTKR